MEAAQLEIPLWGCSLKVFIVSGGTWASVIVGWWVGGLVSFKKQPDYSPEWPCPFPFRPARRQWSSVCLYFYFCFSRSDSATVILHRCFCVLFPSARWHHVLICDLHVTLPEVSVRSFSSLHKCLVFSFTVHLWEIFLHLLSHCQLSFHQSYWVL